MWSVTEGLPNAVRALFWETDPDRVDLDAHCDYVLERVMARGDWAAMKWLRGRYPVDTLADFVRRKGCRLAPRERAYWALISGVRVTVGPGGGRPSWAGP